MRPTVFAGERTLDMSEKKSFWHAFLDFFVLFSGVSTAANLSRTRRAPVMGRGMFLFRKSAAREAGPSRDTKPR
jgi:hypothetical protein